jgi:hypothetical protein
MWVE